VLNPAARPAITMGSKRADSQKVILETLVRLVDQFIFLILTDGFRNRIYRNRGQ
jgi:hypothetical protein